MEGVQEVEPSPKRVHFASVSKGVNASPPSPDLSGWKIGTGAVEAGGEESSTPLRYGAVLGGVAATPGSAAWQASARKVDDLCSRLEELEDALRGMEAKAVAQLDKQLQEKVLATAMKIVERRLGDGELDKKIQEHVLATALKVVQHASNEEGAGALNGGTICKKLELEFAPEGASAAKQAEPVPLGMLEQFAAHIEDGLGQVVRRLEKKVDALQWLLDNDVFNALEARVAEVLGALEARVVAIEKAGLGAQGSANNIASEQQVAAEAVEQETPHAEGLNPRAQEASQPSQQPAAAPTAQCRRPTPRLAATSPAGMPLLGALHTAKEKVARGEAAAAEAPGNRGPWWVAALHLLAWALLAVLGLAACLAGSLSVVMRAHNSSNTEFLS